MYICQELNYQNIMIPLSNYILMDDITKNNQDRIELNLIN